MITSEESKQISNLAMQASEDMRKTLVEFNERWPEFFVWSVDGKLGIGAAVATMQASTWIVTLEGGVQRPTCPPSNLPNSHTALILDKMRERIS